MTQNMMYANSKSRDNHMAYKIVDFNISAWPRIIAAHYCLKCICLQFEKIKAPVSAINVCKEHVPIYGDNNLEILK